MPGFILHAGAQVTCLHGGTATPTAPNPRVMVGNQPVTTQSAPYTVAGCTLSSIPSPPCVTGQWVVAATRVLAGGVPVLLFDSQAVCSPSGQKLQVVMSQARVRAQ